MRHFLLTVIGTVIGIFLFFFVLLAFLMMIGLFSGGSDTPKGGQVLTLDLRQSMLDHSAGENLFGSTPGSVVDSVRALRTAKTDDNIKGLFIRANSFGMVPASAEELRLAINDFKESGKFVIAHSQGFEGTSFTGYMAVSAADEIWQQDTTNFSVAGIRSEVGFMGGVFEKFDAEPQIEQFHEYKSAANAYEETGFTDAHREATTAFLTSLYNVAVDHIAADRDLTNAQVEALFDTAPHSAEAAQKAGLTDKLGHYMEAVDYVKEKAGGDDTTFVSLKDYNAGIGSGPAIAFIGGQGAVVTGGSSNGSSPFGGGVSMGSDTLSKAFEAAIKDKSIKAIVFRVSSPGGSATASDDIHNAVARAKAAGKPVIVSMGQYAASGGYYVSANADHIVAMPSTITGSIGVLGGKVALEDTYAKVGYNVEAINIGGDFGNAYSGDTPFTPSQQAAYRGQLEDIYEDFTGVVAEGRELPLERVLEIAKGRVWTGQQAKELHLVDELGGLMSAIDAAKKIAEIDEDSGVRIKKFPREKTQFEQLEEMFGAAAQAKSDMETMREIMDMPEVQALIKARARLEPGQEILADIPELK
jgi:protease-4